MNLMVAEASPARIPSLTKAISEHEELLGDRGRILVRYSGTEPKLRVMVEADRRDFDEPDAAQALQSRAWIWAKG
jgi:phosphoglucosamine mutase